MMQRGKSSVRSLRWLMAFWFSGLVVPSVGSVSGGVAWAGENAESTKDAAPPIRKGVTPSKAKTPPKAKAKGIAAESPEAQSEPVTRDDVVGLRGQDVFQILLGEIALKRGDTAMAAEAYAAAAERTGDDGLLGRAVQVAVSAQQYDRALSLSEAWVKASPESSAARHALVNILSGMGRSAEIAPHAEKLLALDRDARPRNLLHMTRWYAGADVDLAFSAGRQLLAPYLDLPEAQLTLANLARAAGDKALALHSVREASRLRAGWPVAAYLEAQLQDSVAGSIKVWSEFLSTTKDYEPAFIQRARLYVGEKQYAEAMADYASALALNPNSIDTTYALAILSLQLNDRAQAEKYFTQLEGRDFGGKGLVDYQLGLLAHERKDDSAAMRYFAAVGKGDYYVSARAQLSLLLSRQGKKDEARKILAETEAVTAAERARLAIAEAQLLREAQQFEAALVVLEKALTAHPNEPDLLYDKAMVAERLKRNDVLDSTLARLIELRPDHPQAYNALGYSWADRNIRLEEARQLIAKALELAPQDPFILDSMGWVMFRLGQPKAALVHLEDAYRQRPDPEIAAHIGEVLWSLGRREEARKVWAEARKKFPDNEVLSAVIEKFQP